MPIYKKEALMSYAADFRVQAEACFHLARKATELWVAIFLAERAEELLERADRDSKASPTAASSASRRRKQRRPPILGG